MSNKYSGFVCGGGWQDGEEEFVEKEVSVVVNEFKNFAILSILSFVFFSILLGVFYLFASTALLIVTGIIFFIVQFLFLYRLYLSRGKPVYSQTITIIEEKHPFDNRNSY
ncbi:MAG: hypothetical protein MK193_04390 [Lentisphaeria bacterium]|nr:hypothetical protein [Lentisphaeria bacterium]